MSKRFFWFFPLFLGACFLLHAAPPTKIHRVREIVVYVDGNTRVSAINAYIGLREDDEFSSLEALQEAAQYALQKLINYRVFRETAMDMELLEEQDTFAEWRVVFRVQDSWTIIPLLYPKYDSNTGFRLGFKGYYDNAFGTMSDIYLGLGMNLGPNRTDGAWEIGEWNINPRWKNIRFGSFNFSASYLQAYEEKRFHTDDASREYDYGYYRSELALGSSVYIGESPFSYNFALAFDMKYAYKNFLDTKNFDEEPFGFSWNHGISHGRIDWQENFRNGQNIALSHQIRLVLNPDINRYYPVNDISISGSLYRPIGKIFNYYVRGSAFATFEAPASGIGTRLRGVADDAMSGDWGFFMNNSLAIQFWRLKGVWDAQVHPFFDVGVALPYAGADVNSDIRYSAGLDFVLYMDAIPNLVARGMIGADMSRYDWSDPRKYEIIITASLHY